MNQLLYHLIYQEKTKRWFTIFDQLEERQSVTVKEFAVRLGCSLQTSQSDFKQIKQYFDASILFHGNEGASLFLSKPSDL